MDSSNTINHWEKQLETRLYKSDFLACSASDNKFVQVINGDYLGLFNSLIKGQQFTIAQIEDASSLNNAMAMYLEEHKAENTIFTKLSKNEQNRVLNFLIKANNKSVEQDSYLLTHLTFGLVTFHQGDKNYQAPLVFLPIYLSFDEKTSTYSIRAMKGEIRLNEALRMHLKKTKNIDISYTVDNSFSLSEYIYYIMVKLRPINWIVNNFNYIGNFDFSIFYNYKNIIINKDKIADKDIVKSLAYFNSEFFRFNHQGDKPLDIKFLSLLEMDNEEYNLLKTISQKENYLLRNFSDASTYHLINNIISQYLMNDQRILIAYDSLEQETKIINNLKKSSLDKYAIDLNPLSINKEDEIAHIINYNDYLIAYNSLHPVMIENDVTSYYSYKNSYKNLVNGLRSTKNPLRTSLNKLINNYNLLNKYPLINSPIRGASAFDIDQIKFDIELINKFIDAYKKLGVSLKDHPFYGFNRKTMVQKDYLPLKDSSLKLSNSLEDALKTYKKAEEKFSLPKIKNLKEMKALLNLLTFAEYYESYPLSWLDIKDLDELYDFVKKNKEELDENLSQYMDLERSYNESIHNITNELILDVQDSQKSKKACKKVRKIIKIKKISNDEVIYLCKEIQKLNIIQDELEEKRSTFPSTINEYLSTHSIEEFRDIIDHINLAKYNLDYLKVKNFAFLKPLIEEGKIVKSSTRRNMQLLFNDVLENTEEVQSYFDKDIINFEKISLDKYLERVNKININFTSINPYLDYLVARKKVNTISTNIASEYEKLDELKNVENIFLKRFYYDVIKETLLKDIFLDFTRKGLISKFEKFQDSDERRRVLINKIINNNFNKKLRGKLSEFKKTDGQKGLNILENSPRIYPLEQLIEDFFNSLNSFRPIVLIPAKEVSRLLNNSENHFDCVMLMSNRNTDLIDALPSLISGERVIVVDNEVITSDPRSKIMNNLKASSLIEMANATYKEIEYTSAYEKEESLYFNNNYDLDFKVYLMNKLKEKHFDVGINRIIDGKTIDILVRLPNSTTSIAIFVDHLPYPSPESANKTQLVQEAFAYMHNYAPYRIYPAIYFSHEEEELDKLYEYIIEKSHQVPTISLHKKSILLMNYLFDEYQDPRRIYNYLEGERLEDRVRDFLVETAPILNQDLKKIFKENIEAVIYKLLSEKFIIQKNKYTYVANQPVKFRRVDRDKDIYRPIESVSPYEIKDAVLKIINHETTLEKSTVEKMILLSLGYKKTNKSIDTRLDALINELANDKKIKIDGDYITKA